MQLHPGFAAEIPVSFSNPSSDLLTHERNKQKPHLLWRCSGPLRHRLLHRPLHGACRGHHAAPHTPPCQQRATDYHGLTDAMLLDRGLPIAEVLRQLSIALRRLREDGGLLVAHYMEFDGALLIREYQRVGAISDAALLRHLATDGICTMQAAAAQQRGGQRPPRTDEQLRRFQAREHTPYKKYKITDDDYRNRSRWDDYVRAIDEMVERTGTTLAPWHLVPANDKRWARVQVLETICDAFEAWLDEVG